MMDIIEELQMHAEDIGLRNVMTLAVQEIARLRAENAELFEAMQHPSYEEEIRLRAENERLNSCLYEMQEAGISLAQQLTEALRAEQQWRPIESAPKDGTEVLLIVRRRAGMPGMQLVGHYMPGGHCIDDHPPIMQGWYFWDGCMFDRAAEPTHWKPLPAPPKGD